MTAGLVVLVYAIVKAEDFGWGSGRTLGLAAVALALLAAFVAIERRSTAPLIRLGIFRVRSLAGANTVLLLVVGGLFAFFFLLVALRPTDPRLLAARGRTRVPARDCRHRPGSGHRAAARQAHRRAHDGGGRDADRCLRPVPVPITLIATTNVGDQVAGLASGLFNTAQQVGGALGLAVLSTLAADKSANVLGELGRQPSPIERANALLDGFQVAFTAAAILVAIGAVLLMLAVRKRDVANVDPEAAPLPGA